ncbi:MAG: hypothetical protein ABUL71_00255, partial [Gemmatimonadota bacterium]
MITINLKPGNKRQAAKGDPMAGLRQWAGSLREKVKDPGMLVAGGAWIVVLLAIAILTITTRS